MVTTVKYLSEFNEPYPDWLDRGYYNLGHFFGSRTVFYPGAGADVSPLDTFNCSHSTHCYFFVDQKYSATGLDKRTGPVPTGYSILLDKQYSIDELTRESMYPLPQDKLEQFTVPPIEPVESSTRSYRSRDSSLSRLAAVDSDSAMRLKIYERQPGFDSIHGAKRFAMFFLGMEARTAYEWFYGIMFRGNPPFAVWIKDHGFGADFAKQTANDEGFGDPRGRMYHAAHESGLPEFLVVSRCNKFWRGYRSVEAIEHEPPSCGDRLYQKRHGLRLRPRRYPETDFAD